MSIGPQFHLINCEFLLSATLDQHRISCLSQCLDWLTLKLTVRPGGVIAHKVRSSNLLVSYAKTQYEKTELKSNVSYLIRH